MKRRIFMQSSGMAAVASLLPFPLIQMSKVNNMTKQQNYNVVIVGGSYAGLSAAMALGRSLRRVLIIDSGMPCNRQTPHSHNFITQDGEKPAEIARKAKEQVLRYDTVEFLQDLVIKGEKSENGFIITTKAGKLLKTKKLIFATGISDIMPEISGFSECWGISVVHCPYCHGYELRGKKTGIMANGERAFHLASLVNNLTGQITILTSGKAEFTPEQLTRLHRRNIMIVESEITAIEHKGGYMSNIIFKDGTKEPFEGVYASLPFKQHSEIPVSLGCELNEQGYIRVDDFQQTTVEGVFACGDNSSRMRSVANAVYSGNLTGAMVNHALTEDFF